MFKNMNLGRLWNQNKIAVLAFIVLGAVLGLGAYLRGLISPAITKYLMPKTTKPTSKNSNQSGI